MNGSVISDFDSKRSSLLSRGEYHTMKLDERESTKKINHNWINELRDTDNGEFSKSSNINPFEKRNCLLQRSRNFRYS